MENYNKNIEKLCSEIEKVLKPIATKYSFLNISNEDIKIFILDKINKNINKLDDIKAFTKFVQKRFYDNIQRLTQELLADNIRFINVVNDHLKKCKYPVDVKLANIYLSDLSNFLSIFNCDFDLELISSLINSNSNLKMALQCIIEKYGARYRYVIDDSIILTFLEAYCVIFNIELDEIDFLEPDNEQYDLENKQLVNNENEEFFSDDLFREIIIRASKEQLLTVSEQKELLKKVAEGDQLAREKLYERNQRLVIKIAKQYSNSGLSMLDLFQEGSIGLMTAIDKFDINKNTTLSTYATWWIRHAITRAINQTSRVVRVPVHILEKQNRINGVARQLTIELGREPTIQELSRKVKMSEEKLMEIYEADKQIVSINVPINEDNDTELGDLINSDETPMDVQIIENRKIKVVMELLNKANLTEREIDVILRRYGLIDGNGQTLEAIAKIYSITRERVRQIESKALRKLRHSQHTKELASYMENPDEALRTLEKYKNVYYSSMQSHKKNIDQTDIVSGKIVKVRENHTIYDYLSDYSKENINALIDNLSPLSKELLSIRFGDNLEKPKVSLNWNDEYNRRFRKLINYMKKLLANPNYLLRIKSIYNYFPKYDSLEIDFAIATLDEEEKLLLNLKFGNDYHLPVYNIDWEYDLNNDIKFTEILEKISEVLPKKNSTRKKSVSKSNTNNIYDYYREFDKSRVDFIIGLLSLDELELLKLKFGNELNEFYTRPNITPEETKKLNTLLNRLRFRLSKPTYGKKYNIYELLSDYSKDEIDLAINLIEDSAVKEMINYFVDNGIKSKQDRKQFNNVSKFIIKMIKKVQNVGVQITIYDSFKEHKKENIDYVLAGLNYDEIELLRLKFGNDFQTCCLNNQMSKSAQRSIKLLLDKIENKLNEIKNQKNILTLDIYEYFNEFPKEEVGYVLSQLNDEEMDLLKIKFGERLTLYCRKAKFTEEQETKYRYLMTKMRRMLMKSQRTKKNNGMIVHKISIYEFFKEYTADEIDVMLSKLNDSELAILHKKFGDSLNTLIKRVNWSKEEQKNYVALHTKMKRLLNNISAKKSKNKTSEKAIEKISIYDYFKKYTADEVDIMLSKLNEKELAILKKKFGENLDCLVKRVEWQDDESKKYIALHTKIQRLLKKPNFKIRKTSKKEKIIEKISIYNYFKDYTVEEIDMMISKLNEEELAILKKKFGENLDCLVKRVEWQDGESKKYIALYTKIQRILKNPIPKIREKKTPEKEIVRISIYDYFKDYTVEEIDMMISKLNEEELAILKKKFGENLDCLVKRVEWQDGESKKYIALYTKIQRILKNPISKIRENKTPEKEIVRISIYDYFKDYTVDEINQMLKKLNNDELAILQKKFGENLDCLVKKVKWNEEDAKKYTYLAIKMKKILKSLTKTTISIYDYFKDYTVEEIDVMISKLNEEELAILKKKFGENLDCLVKRVEWQEGESKKYTALYTKMQRLLKIKPLESKEKEIVKKEIIIISIYEYYKDYTVQEVDAMLSKLNDAEMQILKKKFGENLDCLVKRVEWQEGESKKYNALYTKIQRLLKNPDSQTKKASNNKLDYSKKISIYEYFSKYKDAQIDRAISMLNEDDMRYLKLKFGEDLDELRKNQYIGTAGVARCNAVIQKMKNNLKRIQQMPVARKTLYSTTIYQVFDKYSKEQIDYVLSTLPRQDRDSLMQRYGEDFSKPYVKVNEMSGYLLNIIRKINGKLNLLKNKSTPKNDIAEKTIEKTDVEKINSISTSNDFINILSMMPRIDAVILELRFGVYGKIYTTEQIAKLFNKSELEIIDMTRKAFDNLKVLFERVASDVIDVMEYESSNDLTLVKKQD